MPETTHIQALILQQPGARFPSLQPLPVTALHGKACTAAVLRLDELHPVIAGNKWFKLWYALQEVQAGGYTKVVTFGGPWSNHLVATACACKQAGIACTGIVRGQEQLDTATLRQCTGYGMALLPVSRTDYRTLQEAATTLPQFAGSYIIPEGGASMAGARGAALISGLYNMDSFTHLLCPVGTGTTFAGLLQAAQPHQTIVGVNVLKGGSFQENTISRLAGKPVHPHQLLNDYHFGGYARNSPKLTHFMNDWYTQTGIPTDFVYTGKLFYAFNHLLQQDYFAPGSNILLVHTGGLQGNASLPKGLLIF